MNWLTQQEGLQYADLHGYLIEVSDYHREFQASANSDGAHQRREQLIRYRNRLEKIFQ